MLRLRGSNFLWVTGEWNWGTWWIGEALWIFGESLLIGRSVWFVVVLRGSPPASPGRRTVASILLPPTGHGGRDLRYSKVEWREKKQEQRTAALADHRHWSVRESIDYRSGLPPPPLSAAPAPRELARPVLVDPRHGHAPAPRHGRRRPVRRPPLGRSPYELPQVAVAVGAGREGRRGGEAAAEGGGRRREAVVLLLLPLPPPLPARLMPIPA